jgi:nucleoside-diphosphate-sugar epimerase
MIAVVTGGSGFIGQHLIRRLLRSGHEVRCLIRASGGAVHADARRYVVRFNDPGSLMNCEALDRADVVFHLAGATKAVRQEDFSAANVVPTRNLVAAIAARRLYTRFVFVSSQAAAGPAAARHLAVDEDDIPRPIEAYGRSKLEAERVVERYGERVATTIVRPCSVFGPGDRDFLSLFRLAKRGLILYPGVAEHWLSILYVDDLVDGLLAAATSAEAIARKYFLASGRRARHLDLPSPLISAAAVAGEWFGRLTGTAPLANRSKAALSRPRYWVCSASRARRELAFAPTHSLPEAVRETYYWYRENGWLGGARRPDNTVA